MIERGAETYKLKGNLAAKRKNRMQRRKSDKIVFRKSGVIV